MIYVGSSDTKKVTLTPESEKIRNLWLCVNREKLSAFGLVLASVNQLLTHEQFNQMGGEEKVFAEYFKTDSHINRFVVVFRFEGRIVPCLMIPVVNHKCKTIYDQYFVAFKPNSEAPIHLLPYNHAKEEIASQILKTRPALLTESWYKPQNPEAFIPVELSQIAEEA